jgi:hypothetical protein
VYSMILDDSSATGSYPKTLDASTLNPSDSSRLSSRKPTLVTDRPEQGLQVSRGRYRIDRRALQRLWSSISKVTVVDRIALVGVIVVVGMLLLAVQRYCANKRLANRRRNNDES